MKVLVINTSDISGGAARAAYRLHEDLQGLNGEHPDFASASVVFASEAR